MADKKVAPSEPIPGTTGQSSDLPWSASDRLADPDGNKLLTEAHPMIKVSDDDTTLGRLEDKVVGAAGITVATLSPGGNEQLQISGGGVGSISLVGKTIAPVHKRVHNWSGTGLATATKGSLDLATLSGVALPTGTTHAILSMKVHLRDPDTSNDASLESYLAQTSVDPFGTAPEIAEANADNLIVDPDLVTRTADGPLQDMAARSVVLPINGSNPHAYYWAGDDTGVYAGTAVYDGEIFLEAYVLDDEAGYLPDESDTYVYNSGIMSSTVNWATHTIPAGVDAVLIDLEEKRNSAGDDTKSQSGSAHWVVRRSDMASRGYGVAHFGGATGNPTFTYAAQKDLTTVYIGGRVYCQFDNGLKQLRFYCDASSFNHTCVVKITHLRA